MSVGGAEDQSGRRLLTDVLTGEAHALVASSRAVRKALNGMTQALLRAKALRLTATELEELHQGIDALPSSLWAAHMLEAPDGVRTARVLTLAYPSLLEEA